MCRAFAKSRGLSDEGDEMNMTEPVTIEKCTEGRDANGAPTRTFADQSPEIWAKIDHPRARISRRRSAAAEADAAFIIRSNSGLTERDRLRTLDGLPTRSRTFCRRIGRHFNACSGGH